MKKTFCILVLVAGITGALFAQSGKTKSDQLFELPADFSSRRFNIELGKGNKLQLDIDNMEDLYRFQNMDSVIRALLTTLETLKDSLGDELQSRRIDYTTDSLDRNKVRIQLFNPKGSNFLVERGGAAALKLEQDTINIFGTVEFIAKYTLRKAFKASRHYRVSFFLNNLADLNYYLDGSLAAKIEGLLANYRSHWDINAKEGTAYLRNRAISAKRPHGFIAGGDYLNLRFSVDVQNYKGYFVPSFSLGAGLIISNTYFKRDIVLSWDPNFFFAKNSEGRLKTFRNDFLTLTWGQGFIADHDPRKESQFLFIMSLGYLVKRDGEYMEKNTFRMGAGRLSLFGGKTKLEPAIYFDHFFKGVTPAFRVIQSF